MFVVCISLLLSYDPNLVGVIFGLHVLSFFENFLFLFFSPFLNHCFM